MNSSGTPARGFDRVYAPALEAIETWQPAVVENL
jgi:hypothetical protein